VLREETDYWAVSQNNGKFLIRGKGGLEGKDMHGQELPTFRRFGKTHRLPKRSILSLREVPKSDVARLRRRSVLRMNGRGRARLCKTASADRLLRGRVLIRHFTECLGRNAKASPRPSTKKSKRHSTFGFHLRGRVYLRGEGDSTPWVIN